MTVALFVLAVFAIQSTAAILEVIVAIVLALFW